MVAFGQTELKIRVHYDCGRRSTIISVLELYGTKAAYLAAVNRAVDELVREGFILKPGVGGIDDASEYRNRAQMQAAQSRFQQVP